MAEFLSQRLTARLGALLFVLSGLLTIANLALPSPTARNIPVLVVIGGAAMLSGTVAWFLPWHRWPRAATLPMAPLAFVLIALGGMASLRPWSYAVYWVVAFVWLGAAHPPWTSVKFAVPATFGYVSPFFVVSTAASTPTPPSASSSRSACWWANHSPGSRGGCARPNASTCAA